MVILEIFAESYAHLSFQRTSRRCKYTFERHLVAKTWLEVNFQGQTGDIVVDDKAYIKSTEWEIVSKQGVIHEVKYDCCPAVYQATYSIIVGSQTWFLKKYEQFDFSKIFQMFLSGQNWVKVWSIYAILKLGEV